MKIVYKISLFFLMGFCANIAFAQKTQLKKAEKAYEHYAYIDAQVIYLKVVADGYRSAEILKKLGDTYYFNADYKNAGKWYQELIKDFPSETEPVYYFRAAQSLKSEGNYKRSDELMDQFSAVGGLSHVIQNFKENKNYLSDIQSKSDKYILEKAEINTTNSDFGPAFYLNNIVFASAMDTVVDGKLRLHDWNKQPFLNLYMAEMNEDGKLYNMEKLGGDITTKFHESSPSFTKDGRAVYFTRNNFIDGKKGRDKEKNIRLKIYKATKLGENLWTNIEELPFNSATYSVAHPALSSDEKRLYFSSDMPGTIGQSDLWYVDILGDNNYGSPVNLGLGINTEARENFPFISSNNVLYFSTDGRAGLGGLDIYFTQLNEQGLPTEIQTLGTPINSGKDDFALIINEEKNLGFLSSNRNGISGSVGDDIYRVNRVCEITISGLVTDENTGVLLPGSLVIVMDQDNNPINSMTVGRDAEYSFNVECNKQYTIRGTKDKYEPKEKIVSTPRESSSINLPLELKPSDPCPPNDLGCRLSLQPIYFDFDRYNIRPDAAIELAKILAALREYPELIIHIESHTDSRGSDSYNELLSERRAQSTLEWLISKGITRNRLTAKGYGEGRLINECSNGVECTEEAHQLNRRSMFIIKN
ncbi:MAG: flagellar motor protein MotB [Bacteroidetes bacterium HGW-Bacteroidetes-2]|nr:MAG: flagellar motor protein MotB [Bacteroidetes bacterium HGW-Bacteroidetes-2]